MSGNNGPRPPSKREAAFRSEMLAGSTLLAISSPKRIDEDMALASFYAFVPIEAPNASAFRCLD